MRNNQASSLVSFACDGRALLEDLKLHGDGSLYVCDLHSGRLSRAGKDVSQINYSEML